MTLLFRPERFRRVIETSLHSRTRKFPLFLVSFFPFFLPSYIVPPQSNVTVNFIRMCFLFYKTFSKMTHLTETERIEI
jgi:hypothetical protein